MGDFALPDRLLARLQGPEEQSPVFGGEPPADNQAAVLLPFGGEEALAVRRLGVPHRDRASVAAHQAIQPAAGCSRDLRRKLADLALQPVGGGYGCQLKA
jgi:hypothetical protein